MPDDGTQRAKPSDIKAFFQADGDQPVTLPELKTLKETPGSQPGRTAYDEIADGIGNGTLTY